MVREILTDDYSADIDGGRRPETQINTIETLDEIDYERSSLSDSQYGKEPSDKRNVSLQNTTHLEQHSM